MPNLFIKKPSCIVMDVTGTMAKKSFMTYSPESRQFLLKNLKDYVIEQWTRGHLRLAANFIRQELNNPKLNNYPPLADMKAPVNVQVEKFISHIQWRIENDWNKCSASLGIFHLGMSEWAYKKGILKTP